MASGKSDTPQVWEYQGGDWRHRVLRDMTPDELAKRDADFKAYEDMLARQEAYMSQRLRQIRQREAPSIKGCVFAKSCELPDAIIDYHYPTGYIPTELLSAYGAFTLLGGREVDASGCVPLKTISGALPASVGTLTGWNGVGLPWRRRGHVACGGGCVGRAGGAADAFEPGRWLAVHRRAIEVA